MSSNERQKLVVEEMLQKPSEVVPTLLVGLGGAGAKIAIRVKQQLKKRPDYAERFKALTKVALIDTNINDLESWREDADLTLLISDFEKESYANLASGKLFLEPDSYFTQWVPQNYRFRAGDTAGAGQIRIESRLGSYYQKRHGGMVPKIRKLLDELKGHEHGHRRLASSDIRIVVCFSVAGGTGSGSFLPMAYMLRDQAKALGKPYLIGVAVMPAVFEEKTGTNKDGTFANGYAALKELEHLMTLGAPESSFFPEDGIPFHYDPSDESKRVVRTKPFEFTYIIDRPESFTVNKVEEAAADGLYLQLYSPLFGIQAGDYDNYTQHQRFLVPHDFEPKGIKGFTSFYGSYGAAVLHVPTAGVIDYCARTAALGIIRQNLMGEIPEGEAYENLRKNPEEFYRVAESDQPDARQIKEVDFDKQPENMQSVLRDRLFVKRIRLLAAAELARSDLNEKTFLSVFRHGHRLGVRPTEDGKVTSLVVGDKRLDEEMQLWKEKKGNYSLGQTWLPVLCTKGYDVESRKPLQRSTVIDEIVGSKWTQERSKLANLNMDESTVSKVQNLAASWPEDLRIAAENCLKQGTKATHDMGIRDIEDLKFLTEGAQDAGLLGQRYFVAMLRNELGNPQLNLETKPPEEDMAQPDPSRRDERLRDATAVNGVAEGLWDKAVLIATAKLEIRLNGLRKTLIDKLNGTSAIFLNLEKDFSRLDKEERTNAERIREQGDESASQFVLDAEAYQMENGRRLWDFFFADKCASDSRISMSHPKVREKVGERIRLMANQKSSTGDRVLRQIFEDLRAYVKNEVLKKDIEGDPRAADNEKRQGLTIDRALQDEVLYRALYLSNLPKFAARTGDPVTVAREVMATFKTQPEEERSKLSDVNNPLYLDYLRDKLRRVVTERASFLCSYDESRDQQGGVRPDLVGLIMMHKDFENAQLGKSLKTLDLKMKVETKDWNDPRQVVFYRAVLNVPLYVFGRMNEMKEFYHRFKKMAKRSKVLHIDKNWEDTLPDLDPDTAQENHRQGLLRAHVVNFAALLSIKDANGVPYILFREGAFWLRSPDRDMPADSGQQSPADLGLVRLGETMAASIERFPEVLDSERVKYQPYHQLLTGIRDGFAPAVLKDVVKLPFDWRRFRDELRTQYGSAPSPLQQLRLKDFTEAFSRLYEALSGLLKTLRDLDTERRTVGGELTVSLADMSPEQAKKALGQSIDILRGFVDQWLALDAPASSSVPVSAGFASLFKPLPEKELRAVAHNLQGDAAKAAEPPKAAEVTTPATTGG
jgi:hypothetical protein